MVKIKFFSKKIIFFAKPLDKRHFYAIILKCIIIA